jgi:hypothetical protein
VADDLIQFHSNDDLQHGFGITRVIWWCDLVLPNLLEVDPPGGDFSFPAEGARSPFERRVFPSIS